MNEWMNRWRDEWINEWMNEWMHEWMNAWTNLILNIVVHYLAKGSFSYNSISPKKPTTMLQCFILFLDEYVYWWVVTQSPGTSRQKYGLLFGSTTVPRTSHDLHFNVEGWYTIQIL